jgi:hypothetical protein
VFLFVAVGAMRIHSALLPLLAWLRCENDAKPNTVEWFHAAADNDEPLDGDVYNCYRVGRNAGRSGMGAVFGQMRGKKDLDATSTRPLRQKSHFWLSRVASSSNSISFHVRDITCGKVMLLRHAWLKTVPLTKVRQRFISNISQSRSYPESLVVLLCKPMSSRVHVIWISGKMALCRSPVQRLVQSKATIWNQAKLRQGVTRQALTCQV